MSTRIAVGLGNNIDYEITWDAQVLEEQIQSCGLRQEDIAGVDLIRSPKDLLISILYHMQNGIGGECCCENIDDLLGFSQLFPFKVTLGGTSVRAAIAMDKMGVPSFAHLVTDNHDVRRLLPESCSWICSNEKESCYPHLIIQYPKDIQITANGIAIRTHRANRLIYVHDPDNQNMRLDPRFSRHLTDASVFLLSGLNGIQEKSLLERRLIELTALLASLPEEALVFYEDACFHHRGFNRLVYEYLKDRIHMASMNEEELQNYSGRKIPLLDPSSVYEAIEGVREILGVPHLVVHSRYWAILCGPDPGNFTAALEGGVAMATTRFRLGDDFSKEDYRQTGFLKREKESREFTDNFHALWEGRAICVPSFAVEERRVTTIGLGDAFVGGFLPALLQ